MELQVFFLWVASCILGLKYKMTALKVSNAINNFDVVKRDSYKQNFVIFKCIGYLSLLYFTAWLIIISGVLIIGWP